MQTFLPADHQPWVLHKFSLHQTSYQHHDKRSSICALCLFECSTVFLNAKFKLSLCRVGVFMNGIRSRAWPAHQPVSTGRQLLWPPCVTWLQPSRPQATMPGKPAEALAKIVEGRVAKWVEGGDKPSVDVHGEHDMFHPRQHDMASVDFMLLYYT